LVQKLLAGLIYSSAHMKRNTKRQELQMTHTSEKKLQEFIKTF